MTRDEARGVVRMLVSAGGVVSPRVRDGLLEVAEPDREFDEELARIAAAREARERHVRESNRRMVEMLRDCGL